MSWVVSAVAVGTAAYSGYQEMSENSKARERIGELQFPDYYEDPDYRETQDALKELGLGLLSGENIPDYYKDIGETGSQEFEDMLGMTTRDIQRGVNESMALQGRGRGGQLGATSAGAIADAATKLRYSDYERSLTGKQNLLTTGINVTSGVRSAGQQEGVNQNNFNLKELDFDKWKVGELNELGFMNAKSKGETAQSIGGAISGAYTEMDTPTTSPMSSGFADMENQDWLSTILGQKTTKEQAAGKSALGAIDDEDYLLDVNNFKIGGSIN